MTEREGRDARRRGREGSGDDLAMTGHKSERVLRQKQCGADGLRGRRLAPFKRQLQGMILRGRAFRETHTSVMLSLYSNYVGLDNYLI